MKAIKIYLMVVTALLVFALCFGIYVWYKIQKLNAAVLNATEVSDQIDIPVPLTREE